MSLRRLWGVLAIALPVLAALLAPMSTVDLAYQLRAGADILATGSIPTVDAYTATVAGQAWWDQQWAAQAVLAAVNGAAGWTGLVVLRAGLTGLAFAAVLLAAQARGAGARAAAVLAIIAFLLASPALALRPQLFGVALFAGTLWALSERRRRPRVAWLVPLLAVAWANAHGSFVLAPLAAGWAWLEDVVDREPRGRRTFALAATTLAATAVTPWGPWVWGYAAGLSTNAALAARVTEWQPPSPTDPVGAAFLLSGVVVALVVAVRWRAGRRASWAALAWIAGLFLLGLRAIRGLAWWPIGAVAALAPLFAERADAVEPPTPPGIRRLNLALVGILVVAGVALLPAWRPADDVAGPDGVLRDAPAGIVRALRAVAPEGSRLFHPQRWGSWLEYATPGLRTFVDSRIELFPDAVWADYEAVATGAAGWEAVLTARGIDFVVGSPDDVDLERRLTAAGWTRTYAGADGWVFAVPPVAGNG